MTFHTTLTTCPDYTNQMYVHNDHNVQTFPTELIPMNYLITLLPSAQTMLLHVYKI